MKAYLLVEGRDDEAIFQRLLPEDARSQVSIVVAGGRSNITSKARSLLVTRRKPLALITDADTFEGDLVQQRRQTLEDLLRTATSGVPFKVFLAVPEIESWLFAAPTALERISGNPLSPEMREMAEFQPKEVLAKLFHDSAGSAASQVIDGMTDEELNLVRELQPAKELIQFLVEAIANHTEPQMA